MVLFTEPYPVNPLTQSDVRRRLAELAGPPQHPVQEVELIGLPELVAVAHLAQNGGPSLTELLREKASGPFWSDSLYSYLVLARRNLLEATGRLDWWEPFADRLIADMEHRDAMNDPPSQT